MNEEKKPRRNQDYRLEKMDEELLLFNPKTTNILYLNETASLIWQLCDGKNNISEIVSLLKDTFPEAHDSICKDVLETVELFKQHGAIFLE